MPSWYLPELMPPMIESNPAFWKVNGTPIFLLSALPRSTSIPMIVLLSVSKNSFGAYDASLATMKPAVCRAEGSLALRVGSTWIEEKMSPAELAPGAGVVAVDLLEPQAGGARAPVSTT